MNSKLVGVIGTVIINATVILLAFLHFTSSHSKIKEPEEKSIQVTLVTAGNGDNSIQVDDGQKLTPNHINNCPKAYNGIGFTYEEVSQLINDTPHDMPAYQAGIRVGDMLLDSTPTKDNKIFVRVLRYGQLLTFTIKRGKICFH